MIYFDVLIEFIFLPDFLIDVKYTFIFSTTTTYWLTLVGTRPFNLIGLKTLMLLTQQQTLQLQLKEIRSISDVFEDLRCNREEQMHL